MEAISVESAKLRDEIERFVESKYGSKPEHLWEKYPEYEVFRHMPEGNAKGKWFLLIANVTRSQLDVVSASDGTDIVAGDASNDSSDNRSEGFRDEMIYIADVKCDPDRIDELVRKKGYARAYHMNKQQWMAVMLDGSVPLENVESRIEGSFLLTA